jgi:hypothetical protein
MVTYACIPATWETKQGNTGLKLAQAVFMRPYLKNKRAEGISSSGRGIGKLETLGSICNIKKMYVKQYLANAIVRESNVKILFCFITLKLKCTILSLLWACQLVLVYLLRGHKMCLYSLMRWSIRYSRKKRHTRGSGKQSLLYLWSQKPGDTAHHAIW